MRARPLRSSASIPSIVTVTGVVVQIIRHMALCFSWD
jgi:hypothetical protein